MIRDRLVSRSPIFEVVQPSASAASSRVRPASSRMRRSVAATWMRASPACCCSSTMESLS
ncbi:hypothetical protein BJF78_24125 [Pseudonocardia sp. CNS-139]|nr:hypothetical protein BJF78_24125 [Pseudonocardia sp. CNS-139]